ncbi:MSMEG_1061 family FMN-dependent PPOX-type flavoprotein [Prauserella alba]|uniref:ABC transporter domain-containing protein n=1 Tax=Prauserella alba TaxID=176898 RepID=A0ABP4FX76_9PSEU|nr:MSMEG_1061 family FMN-dependent PPOX-type flavoprotein [Prauserella alba]MCP2178934.1 PPOX class probable FMN-dependent enzyme, DR_2398 family [Prauserella alba]
MAGESAAEPAVATTADSGGPQRSTVHTERISLGYGDRRVVDDLSVTIPPGRITVIVGPNACGKSTLLRGMARLLRPTSGAACLDGKSIHSLSSRDVARQLGILPQSPSAPESISVTDLVGRGRSPHQGWFGRWSDADEQAVADAMRATGTLDLADRAVDELSGGQRQRVWIAMALAQRTGVLLLDEPTTFLDLTHQVEVLDLLADLNRTEGTTIVAVLHDLNLACRYADHLVVLSEGRLIAEGMPREVVTEALVRDVFALPSRVIDDPVSATPLIVPIGRHHTSALPTGAAAAGSTAPGSTAPGTAAAGTAVSSEAELREVVEEPVPLIADKAAPAIDDESRRFLEAAPLFLLASAADDGTVDVSPRGDEHGSVIVLDEYTVAFADRPGNRRVDSMRNILRNPRVAMVFLVPGTDHTLRVNGTAAIVRDAELLERLAVKGSPPDLAVVVTVSELFVHCGRAFNRSKLWDPDTWPEQGSLPTAGTLLKAHTALRDALRGSESDDT